MFQPDLHQRRSIRLAGFDYSSAGYYFVTICVHGRESLFGEIVDNAMVLNDAGSIIEAVWTALQSRFSNVILDEFMVMPNHAHGIIIISNDAVGAPLAAPWSKEFIQRK